MNFDDEINRMLRLAEIERKDMPQIKSSELPNSMQKLKDSGIDVKVDSKKIYDIKPTQDDYMPEKVNSIVKSITSGVDISPIVIAGDGHIVDGHHRWLAAKKIAPDKNINVIVINLPISSALKVYEKVSKE